METKLTIKQENFCKEYVKHGNASLAYRLSYDCSKMKDETIWQNACRLTANSKVAARIKELRHLDTERFAAEKEIAVKVLCNIIGMNVDDLFYEDPVSGKPRLRLPHELPKRARTAIQEIDNTKGRVKYKMYSKIEAIKQLSTLLGWDSPTEVNVRGSSDSGNTLSIGFKKKE